MLEEIDKKEVKKHGDQELFQGDFKALPSDLYTSLPAAGCTLLANFVEWDLFWRAMGAVNHWVWPRGWAWGVQSLLQLACI